MDTRFVSAIAFTILGAASMLLTLSVTLHAAPAARPTVAPAEPPRRGAPLPAAPEPGIVLASAIHRPTTPAPERPTNPKPITPEQIHEVQSRLARMLAAELGLTDALATQFIDDYLSFIDSVLDVDIGVHGHSAAATLIHQRRREFEARAGNYLTSEQIAHLRELLDER
ncbi:MAG: hypothetical protein HYY16_06060 [Planctomycetes bacterium]|nr:hypothetical protein [Planctomycetota bacterium]